MIEEYFSTANPPTKRNGADHSECLATKEV